MASQNRKLLSVGADNFINNGIKNCNVGWTATLAALHHLIVNDHFVRIADIRYRPFFRSTVSQMRTLSLCKFRSILG
jgi:hypothetical protein